MIQVTLDSLAALWPSLTRIERAEVVYLLQSEKISQATIAAYANISPRNVRSRKGDSNAFIRRGDIPTGKFNIQIDRADVMNEEMDRRDRLIVNKDARNDITNTVVAQQIFEKILNLVQQEGLQDQEFKVGYSSSAAASKLETETCIMHWSDLHFCKSGDGMSEESVRNALIKYIFDAMQIVSDRRKSSNITNVHVFINGDCLQGTQNFLSAGRESTGSMSYQIVATAQLLISALSAILEVFELMTVTITAGNHGKLIHKEDLANENAELIMGAIIQAYFAHSPDVTVDVSWNSFYRIVDVMGRKFMVTHGDQIQGSGTQETIVAAVKRWDSTATIAPFDEVCIGHFHHCSMFPLPAKYGQAFKARHIWVNGTASRDDKFLEGMGSSPSLQWWLIFSSAEKVTAYYEVDLYDK